MKTGRWHYAVWKSSQPFMMPACMTPGELLDIKLYHGITIVRGDVNCPDCLKAMGRIVAV